MTRICSALLLASLASCTALEAVEPQPAPPPGVVESFNVSPRSLAKPGDTVTLAWSTTDATRVTLEQLGKGPLAIDSAAASGTLQVQLDASATFVLTAAGEGGTDSAVLSVTLEGGGRESFFDASPRSIEPGGTTTLVWNVPDATALSIKPTGGAALDLHGQVASGSVVVSPSESTRYELEASATKLNVDVEVQPAIFSFESAGAPAPGQPVVLTWKTSGGAKLTITREGISAPVHIETIPALIKGGSFSDVATQLPMNGVITYRLLLERGHTSTTANLTVRIGGALKLKSFICPAYVRDGYPYSVSWATSGASSVKLFADSLPVYVAPDAASAAAGSTTLPAISGASQRVRIEVRDALGGFVTDERVVGTVGVPTFVTFTSDKSSITNGGEPVVLSWNVTNARDVRITQTGVGLVNAVTGNVDTGSVTVYPNRATSTYTLAATNGAGNAITPQTVMVTVTNVATLTFESPLPQGANAKVTGHTVVGGAEVWGLPSVTKNAPGDQFIDIVGNGGTSIAYLGPDTTAKLVTLPEVFSTVLYGRRVSGDKLSISINGWFMFSGAAISGPDTKSAFPTTVLEPLAVAPYFDDLYDTAAGEIYTRIDDANGERRLIVQWDNVEHDTYDGSQLTFEAQVYQSGKVVFAYAKMDGVPGGNGPSVGIVSGTETDAVFPTSAPAPGDTFTFFNRPAVLPQTLRVENAPYVARVAVGPRFVEVEGDAQLKPGQFLLTEANPRPGAAIVNGEWLEVTNTSSTLLNLNGWTLNFGATSKHVITTSVPLPPNGRIVLAQATDLGDPTAGVTAAYVYPATFAMSDTSGTVSIDYGTVVYTRLAWSSPAAGVSVKQDQRPGAIYAGSGTCAGTGTYGTQTGSPGQTQTDCFTFPYVLSSIPGNFESIVSSGTLLHAGADEALVTAALPSPVRYFGSNYSTLYVSTNGWISTTAGTDPVYSNRSTPAASAPIGSIAPFWDDLSATVQAGTGLLREQKDPDGTPGNGDEYTIISWEGWRFLGTSGQLINFQVKFFANGDLEYHFGQMLPSGTSSTGTSATTWLENPTGTMALAANVNAAGISPNSGYRFTYVP